MTTRQLKKHLYNQVDEALEDIDIDFMVKTITSNKEVEKYVRELLNEQLTEMARQALMLRIKKYKPELDYWADEQVREFIMKYEMRER